MRTFFIWIFGLTASAIAGAMAGETLQPNNFGGFWGLFLGMATFSCLRLWLAPRLT